MRAGGQSSIPIDEFQMMIAEYGMYFGYEGMKAVLDDKMSMEQMTWQLVAARKVRSGFMYDISRSVLSAVGAVQTKNPSSTFKSMNNDLLKNSKADV